MRRRGRLDDPTTRFHFGELTRRDVLRGAGVLGVSMMLASCGGDDDSSTAIVRAPGSLPQPLLPEGTDTLPQIEHVVILMMENHSFDSYFGALDATVGLPRRDGVPDAANPDGQGNLIHSFHMPTACQLPASPSQTWNASHISFADGRNDGFVLGSGPVAMGYWTGDDIPFYYGLATTFPLATRWFGSTLCQTYPNRRFLMAGTAAGITSTNDGALGAPPPPNGNIFERLDHFGISWRNYHTDSPSAAILIQYAIANATKLKTTAEFFADVAAGNLPAVSLVDPAFEGGSEENPDDIRIGEAFASRVIRAVMAGPGWPRTLLVWLYDEHGGYYDHVPPPAAIPPDDIPPNLGPDDVPGAYDRYGFRVPAVVVSPYARRNYVSSVVRDHTAILAFIERKWNLGALTYRDANADDLLDCLDFRNPPAFLEPPELPAPALDEVDAAACTPGDPGGPIPPPEAVSPDPAPHRRRVATDISTAVEMPMGEPLRRVWERMKPRPA